MVVDEARRLSMVRRLHEVSGEDVTDTLLAYLPPGGWSNVATRGDIAELRGDTATLGAELRGEMGTLGAELRGDMGTLGAELRGEMASLRTDLRGEMTTLGAGLRGEMAALRTDLRGEMGALGAELRGDMAMLSADLKGEMAKLGVRVESQAVATERQMHLDNRTVFFAMVGVFIAYGTGLVAAVRLH